MVTIKRIRKNTATKIVPHNVLVDCLLSKSSLVKYANFTHFHTWIRISTNLIYVFIFYFKIQILEIFKLVYCSNNSFLGSQQSNEKIMKSDMQFRHLTVKYIAIKLQSITYVSITLTYVSRTKYLIAFI